jgi:hypothetical protein
MNFFVNHFYIVLSLELINFSSRENDFTCWPSSPYIVRKQDPRLTFLKNKVRVKAMAFRNSPKSLVKISVNLSKNQSMKEQPTSIHRF